MQCKTNFIVWFTRLVQFYIKKWQRYVGTHPTFCYQVILPDVTYEEKLAHLSIPVLNDLYIYIYIYRPNSEKGKKFFSVFYVIF